MQKGPQSVTEALHIQTGGPAASSTHPLVDLINAAVDELAAPVALTLNLALHTLLSNLALPARGLTTAAGHGVIRGQTSASAHLLH